MPRPTIFKFLLTSAVLTLANSATADFAEDLAQTLVKRSGEDVVAAPADALEGKEYIAVYYSAHWCPPCRLFTPKLSKFYDETVKEHPEFEIVFVSSDRSPKAMAEYMNYAEMNFLAVEFSKARDTPLREHAARGIPYLILLDADGNVLIEKPADELWAHPEDILPKIGKLLEDSKA